MTRGLRLPESVAACLFDLDGVLTRAAELHAAAWKEAFNGVLQDRTTSEGAALPPFDLHADYETYVDGAPMAYGRSSPPAASSWPRGRPLTSRRRTRCTAWEGARTTSSRS